VCPFEISSPSAAFLDWLFMMIKEHALCIFDTRVAESSGRMKVRGAQRLARASHASNTTRAVCSKGTKAGTSSPPCGCK
jgi:hypothetical protein